MATYSLMVAGDMNGVSEPLSLLLEWVPYWVELTAHWRSRLTDVRGSAKTFDRRGAEAVRTLKNDIISQFRKP